MEKELSLTPTCFRNSASRWGRQQFLEGHRHRKSAEGRGKHRVRFRLGNILDWVIGTQSGQLWGFVCCAFVLIGTGAIAWHLAGGSSDPDVDTSWDQSFWVSWALFFDPGFHGGLSAQEPSKVRLTGAIFSILGFLFNLVFLGVVVDGVRGVIEYWRRDRNRVLAVGHTLVLGWTEKTLFLLNEMLEEAENWDKGRHIVILAERDEIEMWQDIRHHFSQKPSLFKHCTPRTGCPYDIDDLMRAGINEAQDVILLGRDGPPREADLEVVRVVLACASLPKEIVGKVIAEVRCSELTRVLKRILPRTDGIHARSSVNTVLCLIAAQPAVGLSFQELCSFAGGVELYAVEAKETHKFSDACQNFTRAVCIGVQTVRKGTDASMLISPSDDMEIQQGDRLLLISPDVSTFLKDLSNAPSSASRRIGHAAVAPREEKNSETSERPSTTAAAFTPLCAAGPSVIFIVGWPNDFADLVQGLDLAVPASTTVHVLAQLPVERRDHASELKRVRIVHHVGERTSVQHLRRLDLAKASAILVLAECHGDATWDLGVEDTAGDDTLTSDSECLTCVLMIADLLEGQSSKPHLICEVLDPRTDRLLERNEALYASCTFFRSSALETGMFAIATSEPCVFNALLLLLQPGGASLEVTSISEFLDVSLSVRSEESSFWQLHDRVRKMGDMLIGWQRDPASQPSLAPTDAKGEKLTWKGSERLLVIRVPRQTSCVLADEAKQPMRPVVNHLTDLVAQQQPMLLT